LTFHYVERENIFPDLSPLTEKWLVDHRLNPDLSFEDIFIPALKDLKIDESGDVNAEIEFKSFDHVVLESETKDSSWHDSLDRFDRYEVEMSLRHGRDVYKYEMKFVDSLGAECDPDAHESNCVCQRCKAEYDAIENEPVLRRCMDSCCLRLTQSQIFAARYGELKRRRNERLCLLRSELMQKKREEKVSQFVAKSRRRRVKKKSADSTITI
jgi:hypothetical protein